MSCHVHTTFCCSLLPVTFLFYFEKETAHSLKPVWRTFSLSNTLSVFWKRGGYLVAVLNNTILSHLRKHQQKNCRISKKKKKYVTSWLVRTEHIFSSLHQSVHQVDSSRISGRCWYIIYPCGLNLNSSKNCLLTLVLLAGIFSPIFFESFSDIMGCCWSDPNV